MKWLEKIRQKDDIEKQRFAMFYAFLFTSIIFLIWLVAKIYDFSNSTETMASPFESFKNMIPMLK